MKKLVSAISAFAFAIALSVCGTANAAENSVATVSGKGQLDLQALSTLAKQAHNASEFERLLNEEGSINNLDLDGDGYVDYIRVEEYKTENVRGFALLDGDQEVARVEVEHTSGGVDNVVLEGNPTVYEDGGGYWSWEAPYGEYPLFVWLWAPRPWFYLSPWHTGYYPGWYRHYRPVPWNQYSWRTRDYRGLRHPDMRRYLGYNRGPSHGYWRNDPRSHQVPGQQRHMNQPTLRNSPNPFQHTPQPRSHNFSQQQPRHSPQQRSGISSPPRSTRQAPQGGGRTGGSHASGQRGKR